MEVGTGCEKGTDRQGHDVGISSAWSSWVSACRKSAELEGWGTGQKGTEMTREHGRWQGLSPWDVQSLTVNDPRTSLA